MIQITPQMRILVAIEAVDGRKYAPSIDMRSYALPTPQNSRLRGSGRRITDATFWAGAWRATCQVAGSNRVVRLAGPKTPWPPAFLWDRPSDRPPCFGA